MSRLETIANAFLRFLYDDNRFRPEVATFLSSPHARSLSPPITGAEFDQVLRGLRNRELISTPRSDDTDVPSRAGLTGFGLICVDHYGGDVAAWARSQSSPVTVLEQDSTAERGPNTTPDARDQPVPVMVPPKKPVEAGDTPATLTGLVRVARVALLTLPTVHARYGETEVIEQTARNLLEAAQQPEPERRRVRLLANELRSALMSGSVANTLGVVLMDSLDEAIEEGGLR
ncbi:hypothetical protein [Parasphingorhabdus pacifica]